MATIRPNTPTFSTVIAANAATSSATPGAVNTLDLRTSYGAWLYVRIGRVVATALTRAAYVAVRRSNNNGTIHPQNSYDCVSTTAAVNATTVSSGGASGSTTMVLASGTGFAAGQTVCAQLSGNRCEFFQITDLATATITSDRAFRVGHNANDVVTNGADVFSVWLPGGDIYEIYQVNNSGQSVVFEAFAAVYASDDVT